MHVESGTTNETSTPITAESASITANGKNIYCGKQSIYRNGKSIRVEDKLIWGKHWVSKPNG